MNVIFLDIDGVIRCSHNKLELDEKKFEVLGKICSKYNCNVVLSSSWILTDVEFDETTEEFYPNNNFLELLELFKKYNINFIGMTPAIPNFSRPHGQEMWKEYDIQQYLNEHPNVEHICIIDDEEYDLESLKDYLVLTKYYCENPSCEGLTNDYIEKIGEVLKKEVYKPTKTYAYSKVMDELYDYTNLKK